MNCGRACTILMMMMMMMQMGVRFTAEVTTWMPSAMPKLAKYLVAIACGCRSAHKLVKLFQLGENHVLPRF
jgi:hypothetical protein